MTLQEAIKSGKPFKLPAMRDYLIIIPAFGVDMFYWYEGKTLCQTFTVEAVLSEGWHLREVPDNVILMPFRPKGVVPFKPKDGA